MGCGFIEDTVDVFEDVADVATGGLYGSVVHGEWGLQDEFDSLSGRDAARRAEQAQLQGQERAAELLQQYYDQARTDREGALQTLQEYQNLVGEQRGQVSDRFQPYTSAGAGATNILSRLMSGDQGAIDEYTNYLTSTPDYQFALDQGVSATRRGANAQGAGYGGNVLRELTEYGSGLASQTINNSLARLMGLSQQGLSAAGREQDALNSLTQTEGTAAGNVSSAQGNLASQTENLGFNLAQNARDQGLTRASGYTNRYNAGAGFVEDVLRGVGEAAQAYGGGGA